jgi:hypothetical protein
MYQNEVCRKHSAKRREALSNAYCSAASSVKPYGSSASHGWRNVVQKKRANLAFQKSHGMLPFASLLNCLPSHSSSLKSEKRKSALPGVNVISPNLILDFPSE